MLGYGARILLINVERGNLDVDERGLNMGMPHQTHKCGQADSGMQHVRGEGVAAMPRSA